VENLTVHRRIILKYTENIELGEGGINVNRHRDNWWAAVNIRWGGRIIP
jgi:hypothetical protein